MSDVTLVRAAAEDVRAVALRRQRDETSVALALEAAEHGTAWAARDDGEAVGLCVAHQSDNERWVGDLFVESSYRGQGIGARLLDAAFDDVPDVERAASFDAGDPAAMALVVRRGLTPCATLVNVAGVLPREDALLAMAAGDYRFDVGAIDPIAHAYALDALDRETRGVTRSADHQRFGRGAAGVAFLGQGEFLGYAYVWPDGRIGPIAAGSAAYLVQIFAYAFVTLQRAFGASWCTALIPAANLRLLRAALRAGLRIRQTFVVAADVPPPDLSRYAGFHPLIF